MQELFKTVWKDPVGSKVISALILASFSLISESARTFFWSNWYYLVIGVLLSIIFLQRHLFKRPSLNEIEADKYTYEKVLNLFNNQKLIERIRTEDHCVAFRNDIFDLLDELRDELRKDPTSYEFIDDNFNKLFQKTIFSINEFDNYLQTNTWAKNNIDYSSIPLEWKHEMPDKYYEVVNQIQKLKRELCINLDEFTRQGRLKLQLKLS